MGRLRSFNEEDVLERATELFWCNGFNGTSMSELVETTGLAKASLYNAFGNKEDFFKAVLSHYIEKKQSKNLAFLKDGENGRVALEAYLHNILHVTTATSPSLGCLLVNTATERGMHDAAIRKIVDGGMSRTEQHIAAAIERGIQDGSIADTADPNKGALCLIAMILGIRVMARKGDRTERIRTLITANLDAHAPSSNAMPERLLN